MYLKKWSSSVVGFRGCPGYIQPNRDSSRPTALVNSSKVFVHRASCSRFSQPTVETRLAYRLWTLTCPKCTIKAEGVGGSDLQNFTLIHTSCTTITFTINALPYFYHTRCRNWQVYSNLVVFFLTCVTVFFPVLTLTSASPLPIDTNEIAAREAQVRYFGYLLIQYLANFLLNIQLPPCTPFTCT